MNKLVRVDDCGNFGVPGIHMIEVPNELYSCVCKLKDYERCNLQPDEVEDLVSELLDSDQPDLERFIKKLKYRKNR